MNGFTRYPILHAEKRSPLMLSFIDKWVIFCAHSGLWNELNGLYRRWMVVSGFNMVKFKHNNDNCNTNPDKKSTPLLKKIELILRVIHEKPAKLNSKCYTWKKNDLRKVCRKLRHVLCHITQVSCSHLINNNDKLNMIACSRNYAPNSLRNWHRC